MKRNKWKLPALAVVLLACAGCLGMGCRRGGDRMEVEGVTRHFRLHAPPNAASLGPIPLVLALHQFSDTARGMERLTHFNDLADAEGFIVAYPQGRWRVWNSRGDGKADDVAFLSALVDHIAARHSVDMKRVYATGASAGGMMVQRLACQTDFLAAIAPVMGSMDTGAAERCPGGAPLPVLLLHGDADPVVPYNGGETYAGPGRVENFLSAMENAAFWARRNGCAGEPMTEELPDDGPEDAFSLRRTVWPCATGNEALLYTVVGGGHTWPGGDNRYPRFITGPAAPVPDASRLIWDFFKQHTKP